MTTNPLQPTPALLLSVCDTIDEGVGDLINDVMETYDWFGKYETDTEVRVLFSLLVRHIEATLTCLRSDLVLFPSGCTLTRASFEQSIRIRWLLHPNDPFDREARFLTHLATEEKMWSRCAELAKNDQFTNIEKQVKDFRTGVQRLLPQGPTAVNERMPSLEAMINEIDDKKRYIEYILLSVLPWNPSRRPHLSAESR